MACTTRPGVAPYVKFIEEVTGEKVTQGDWHYLRKHVAEKTGIPMSRERVNVDTARAVSSRLSGAMYVDEGIDYAHESAINNYNESFVRMQESLDNGEVTAGTVAALDFLAENGVSDTLTIVRKNRHRETKVSKVLGEADKVMGLLVNDSTRIGQNEANKVFQSLTSIPVRDVVLRDCSVLTEHDRSNVIHNLESVLSQADNKNIAPVATVLAVQHWTEGNDARVKELTELATKVDSEYTLAGMVDSALRVGLPSSMFLADIQGLSREECVPDN